MNKDICSTAYAIVVAATVFAGSGIEAHAVQSINRYCAASWQQASIPAQDWEDCTQQVFLELLNRVSRNRLANATPSSHTTERQELVRAIWSTVQRWRRIHRYQAFQDDDTPDTRQEYREVTRNTRELISEASRELTERQQSILNLLLDGATVAEIADTLDTSTSRVSDEKYKAIQKLRHLLASKNTAS